MIRVDGRYRCRAMASEWLLELSIIVGMVLTLVTCVCSSMRLLAMSGSSWGQTLMARRRETRVGMLCLFLEMVSGWPLALQIMEGMA